MRDANTMNLSYERMKISTYLIVGGGFAITFLTGNGWAFIAGFLSGLGLRFLWSWQRTRDFRRYAQNNGFAFLGDLPRPPLSLQGTALAEKSGTITKYISGKSTNAEIAIFDFSFRRGKAAVCQTIVGFRKQAAEASDWTMSGLVGVYHLEWSGSWLLCYVPRRVVEVDELEDWCGTLRDLIRLTGTKATTEVQATLNLHRLYTEIG